MHSISSVQSVLHTYEGEGDNLHSIMQWLETLQYMLIGV